MLLAVLSLAGPAEARVRLESICSVYGQKPLRLTGVGLVVGLDGTGDGKDAAPSVEALGRALDLMGNPVVQASLKDADNVAIVMLEAEVPANSVRIGQRIDVVVSSVLSAVNLRGGRLLVAPLQLADRRSSALVATASGGIAIEDTEVPTTGRITGGAIIEADLFDENQFLHNTITIDPIRGPLFTLLLDPNHAGFGSSVSVSASVNAEFRDVAGQDVARPVGPGTVEVVVPEPYFDSPVEFIAEVLDIGVDRPQSQARVVVNNASQTVIVTGEAEISPVVISNPGLQIELGPSFRTLADPTAATTTVQLRQLVGALSQLQVSTADVINIIRELNHSGKLHAVYEER